MATQRLGMDDLQNQLEKRDRRRRHLQSLKTPEQRLEEMSALQATWDLLRASPAGYAQFLRLNFKKRSIATGSVDAPRS